MRRGVLSKGAARFLEGLRLSRPTRSTEAPAVQARARMLADMFDPDAAPGAPHHAVYVMELEKTGRVEPGAAPDNGRIRRACPFCAGIVHWVVVKTRHEAAWCPSCGPLDIWLVVEDVLGHEPETGAVVTTTVARGFGSQSCSGLW